MLTPDLVDFLKEGLAIMMATRDCHYLCRGTRAYGIIVHENLKDLTFYINELSSPDMIKNLLDNGEVSLAIGRSTDYKAIQIKGKYLSHRKIDERDQLIIEHHVKAFAETVEKAGGEKEPYLHTPHLPAIAISMKIDQVYNQTPGPGSGGTYDA